MAMAIAVLWLNICAAAAAAGSGQPDYASLAEGLIFQLLGALQQESSGEVRFREWRITEYLDRRDRVVRTEQAEYEWQVRGRERQSRLISGDGTTDGESLAVEKTAAAPGWTPQQWKAFYDFKVIDSGDASGRTLRLRISPKKIQRPPRGRLARVLAGISGEVQYSPLDSEPEIRLKIGLKNPVRFGLWTGKVSHMEIDSRFRNRRNRWLPESFRFEIRVRKWMRTLRVRQQRQYSRFEAPAGQDSVTLPR